MTKIVCNGGFDRFGPLFCFGESSPHSVAWFIPAVHRCFFSSFLPIDDFFNKKSSPLPIDDFSPPLNKSHWGQWDEDLCHPTCLEEEEERSSIIELKRHARLTVARLASGEKS